MANSTLDLVQALFDATVQLPAGERLAYLSHSGDPPEIKSEVLRLLEHDKRADDFLARPAIETFPALICSVSGALGEFRILREIGRGGMGVVYLAHDTILGRDVALKVLSVNLTQSPTGVDRFRREAQAAARLKHPAVVPIYRYGEDRGAHFIAMEYIEGQSLEKRLQELRAGAGTGSATRQSPNRLARDFQESHPEIAHPDHVRACARLVRNIARGLDYAHKAGVLHRDVKPSNILVDAAGDPHLTDFGIALLETENRLTCSGDFAGTYRYMSPEQAASGGLDCRTDVFSLGVVLYEMLTLQWPFRGDNIPAIAESIRKDEPRPLQNLNHAVSLDLQTICLKSLEKKPEHRYPTAGQLAADLDCFLRGEPIMARPPSTPRKLARWVRKRKAQSIAAAFVLLLSTLVVAGGFHLQNHWQSMASVSIQLISQDVASASVQRWNHSTQRFENPDPLGPLPLVGLLLEPDLCRFTVIAADGRFVEFDEILVAGGSVNRVVALPDPQKIAEAMVAFPSGLYTFCPFNPYEEKVDQVAFLDGFLLDLHEVTNGQYRDFVNATGHPPPKQWLAFGYDEELSERPVVGVTQADAAAYALWRGKRLPTAAEWEAAARSPDGRLYPWGIYGDTPASAVPAYDALVATQSLDPLVQYREYVARTSPVAADPAPHAANGLMFLLGNVCEVTSTVAPQSVEQVAIRGGSWSSHPQHFDLRSVATYPRDQFTLNLGFRCARSLAAPNPPAAE